MTGAEQASAAGAVPRRVWGGTGLLVLGRLWSSLCTLTILYLLAWRLGGEDFGRFTFYLALFAVLDSLAELGTGQVSVQLTADDPGAVRGVLRAARRIRLVAGSVGVALVGGGALVLEEPGAAWILLASLYPLTHALELSTIVFKNRIAWSRPVLVRAIASALSLGFVVWAVLAGVREPAVFLVGVAAGSAVGNVLLHLVGRRQLPPERGPAVPVGPVLRAALPMGVAGLCQQTYFYVDNVFVRAIEGEVAVGHYNLAVRVMGYAIMIAVYATLAALPWLTREHRAGRLGAAVTRLAQPMFALAGLATGLLWPFCEPLLALFGEPFVVAAPSLRWLLLATLAVYLGAPFVTAVIAAGRTGAVLWVSVLGLAVNLVGNALLVPARGIEGAAIATCATELAVAAGALAVLRRAGERFEGRALGWRWIGGPAGFMLGLAAASLVPLP